MEKEILFISKKYPKKSIKNITINSITANTKNKHDILKSFDETSDDSMFILSSCRTIGEGVDLVELAAIEGDGFRQSGDGMFRRGIGRGMRPRRVCGD